MSILIPNIFANYEAIEVLDKSIQNHKKNDMYCLGNVLSFGPDPLECFKYIYKKAKKVLMGFEDSCIFYETRYYDFSGNEYLGWIRNTLFSNFSKDDWEILSDNWYEKLLVNGNMYIHNFSQKGLYQDFLIDKNLNIKEFFKILEGIDTCFFGDMIFPGVLTENGEFYTLKYLNYKFNIESIKEKKIVFVGSFGFPLKNSNTYVLYDHPYVYWILEEYTPNKTVQKIQQRKVYYPSEEYFLWGYLGKDKFLQIKELISCCDIIKLT